MIKLKNEAGIVKECPTGFSWTTLFFGFLVPMIRGSWKYAILSMLAAGFTAGLAWLVIPFIINKHHIESLLEQGYTPETPADADQLKALGIIQGAPEQINQKAA